MTLRLLYNATLDRFFFEHRHNELLQIRTNQLMEASKLSPHIKINIQIGLRYFANKKSTQNETL